MRRAHPSDASTERHVGPVLAIAIVALPPIFVWLLLRRGYAPSTRRAALFFTLVTVLPGIILAAGGA